MVRPFVIKICAFLAKRYLNRYLVPVKKELISTRSFILKAETKYAIVGEAPGKQVLEKWFSIHISYPPGEISPGPSWWYEKYLIADDGSYKRIRTGRYPYVWE